MGNAQRTLGLAVFLFSGRASALLPPGIYITDQAVDTGSPTFEKDLKKQSKKAVAAQENGKWHFFYVAYLSKPAPEDQLNIVFYEAKAKGKQEPVAYPINTSKGAKIVAGDVTCAPENEIKKGPYDVRITVLAGGKELVLARTHLDLK